MLKIEEELVELKNFIWRMGINPNAKDKVYKHIENIQNELNLIKSKIKNNCIIRYKETTFPPGLLIEANIGGTATYEIKDLYQLLPDQLENAKVYAIERLKNTLVYFILEGKQ